MHLLRILTLQAATVRAAIVVSVEALKDAQRWTAPTGTWLWISPRGALLRWTRLSSARATAYGWSVRLSPPHAPYRKNTDQNIAVAYTLQLPRLSLNANLERLMVNGDSVDRASIYA